MSDSIRVWCFDAAPEVFKNLSTNGGDEDWVVFVPTEIADKWYEIDWISRMSGTESIVNSYPVDGGTVHITAHA